MPHQSRQPINHFPCRKNALKNFRTSYIILGKETRFQDGTAKTLRNRWEQT